ncbi:hypothetical protein EYV18_23240, partial [Escherichia coli]
KLIMLPSETMIWQPEFTDKTLSRKPGAVQAAIRLTDLTLIPLADFIDQLKCSFCRSTSDHHCHHSGH